VGSKAGKFRNEAFVLRRCPRCNFTFVANPWTCYSAIYSAEYYAGKGADPLVDYEFELERPEETIRGHEWRGITAVVRSLVPVDPSTTWLDFGCGNGGLVRYCRSAGICQAVGFEEGAIRDAAIRLGIPFVDESELERRAGTFDVITAIEVLEHVEHPVKVLQRIRSLLRPGGLFFYTTGNAAPHAKHILKWPYVVPEIHISFYEPETLRLALQQAGFRPEFRGYIPGFAEILRFKILKHLHVRRRRSWQNALPWAALARMANARHRVTDFPIGWAE
jgi:SAM-dependent methyltransferase